MGGSSPELEAAGVSQIIEGVDVTSAEGMQSMLDALDAPVDVVINNAGYFYEPLETIQSLNFEEQLKQIDICGCGPLRVSAALVNAGKLAADGKIIIISSQAGSVEWRFTQNPEGQNYGHHMGRAACNIAGVLLAQELR